LKNGTSYRFRVAALNIAGAGAYSAITVSAPKAVPTAPGKPTATASNTKVKLGWAKPAKAGGGAVLSYTVQRSLDGVKWTTATSSAPLTRTYTVTGLTNGKVYHFRVAAKNKYGVGPWSAVTTAKPH
jgi:predicted phage tail protein